MDAETKQIVVREIPVDLWKRFKLHAVENDQTIQAALAKAIDQYLKKSA